MISLRALAKEEQIPKQFLLHLICIRRGDCRSMDSPKRLKNLSGNIIKWKLETSKRKKDFFGNNLKSKSNLLLLFFIIKIKPITGKERRNYGSK